MKSISCLDFLICYIFILTIFGLSNGELEQTKNRRGGGASGLYAFPRVGRSDPSLNNNNLRNTEDEFDNASPFDVLYPVSADEYEAEYPKSDIKRASLIAQPRIGRTDPQLRKLARYLAWQQALDKRTGPSATTGVWFGPRLGKRSVDQSMGQKEEY